MTINYGKRNLGAGTAASPGDTLYIPLAFYNDSGASISIGSSLAVTDIELFKDGSVTQRATDSGYARLGDTGNFDNRVGFKGISIQLFNTADDPSFYANGSMYWVAIDSVTVDGRTVRFFPAVFEIGEPRANIVQVGGDTGAANYLKTTFANGFNDTGVANRFDRIQYEVDTGLRVHIDDSDTGTKSAVSQAIAWLDTGLRDHIDNTDTGLRANIAAGSTDTGAVSRAVWNSLRSQHGDTGSFGEHLGGSFGTAIVDTGVVNQAVWQTNAQRKLTVDTGIADQVWMQAKASYTTDTGTFGEHLGGSLGGSASVDTGQINQAVWQANAVRGITAIADTGLYDTLADYDTGTKQRLGQIQSDVDTGLRTHIDDLDTGLANLSVSIAQVRGDTGAANRWFRFLEKLDTGGDLSVTASSSVDTGQINQAVWQANASRGITAISDTGVNQRLGAVQTKTDSLTFTVSGQVDSNVQYVNDVQIQGAGTSGDTWRPA